MWNTTSAAIVERDGKQAGGEDVYSASKTLAERAMWDFVANEKPSFDFTSIIPVWNFGPYIHQVCYLPFDPSSYPDIKRLR